MCNDEGQNRVRSERQRRPTSGAGPVLINVEKYLSFAQQRDTVSLYELSAEVFHKVHRHSGEDLPHGQPGELAHVLSPL